MINRLKEVDYSVKERITGWWYLLSALLFLKRLERDVNGQGNRSNN